MRKNIFSPYAIWSNIFKRPETIQYPKEDLDVFDKKGASPTYRGMHSNDLEKCIGCGTCMEICTTSAISMKPYSNTGPGKKGEIPVIDYGRCCYCGFCVDVCPSSSLTMSRDYIYTVAGPLDKLGTSNIKAVSEAFKISPNDRHADNPGYTTPDEFSWLDLERVKMEEATPETRIQSFMEIVKGFSMEQAVKEASRCIECEVCVETCPAHMEIPQYIRAVWENDFKKAVSIMYNTNPLPGICGRICTHKCEEVCSISLRGDPIAIRWLKRYAVDMLPDIEYNEIIKKTIVENNKKVAVIGSGPAGLSAAYYLRLAGYKVTVYEALSNAGGMMRVGVPKYRLPYESIDRDIQHIISIGITLKLNTKIGKDKSVLELQKSYDAVFISTGLHVGRSLGFDAEKLPYVKQAIDLLRESAMGRDIPLSETISIIGGGNVAMDIARTCARLQKKKYGAISITVVCLENRTDMPADEEEILESLEEGITIFPGYGPRDIIVSNSFVTAVDFIKCLSVFDENGMFAPRFDENSTLRLKTSMVIEAVGQSSDLSYLSDDLLSILEKTPQNRIKVSEYNQTSIPWLFAGGDITKGPDAINAIADGHAAAKGIDLFLSQK